LQYKPRPGRPRSRSGQKAQGQG